MGLESVGLADRRRRRLMLVLVGLGVRVVALHRHRVPHAWRDDVGQGFDCVCSVYFVTGDARHFVHNAENTTLAEFRSLPLVAHYPMHCNPCGNSRTHRQRQNTYRESRKQNNVRFTFENCGCCTLLLKNCQSMSRNWKLNNCVVNYAAAKTRMRSDTPCSRRGLVRTGRSLVWLAVAQSDDCM